MDYKNFMRTNAAIKAVGSIGSAAAALIGYLDSSLMYIQAIPSGISSATVLVRDLIFKKKKGFDKEAYKEAENDKFALALMGIAAAVSVLTLTFMIFTTVNKSKKENNSLDDEAIDDSLELL